MRAFAHPNQSLHDPQFFLMRGRLRSNFEVPARATSLRSGLAQLGIPVGAPANATLADAARLHAPDYLAFLRHDTEIWGRVVRAGNIRIDG